MACTNCGECCSYVSFDVSLDVARWCALHGFTLAQSTLFDFVGFQNAKVYVPCSLRDGVTKRCRDYEGRPDVCREFFCEKAKETM